MYNITKNQVEGYVIGKCKSLIIDKLQNNSNIVSLILGLNATPVKLKDTNIFDTLTIDLTQSEAKTYITMDALILNSGASTKCIEITVNTFTYLTLRSLSAAEQKVYYPQGFYGNRIDVICDQILRLLNGSTEFGIGALQLREKNSMGYYQPNVNYYGKYMVFQVYDF